MNTNFLTWLTTLLCKVWSTAALLSPRQLKEVQTLRSQPTPTLSMCSNKMPRQVLKLEKHNWGDCSLNSPSALQLSDLLSPSPLLQARTVPATWGVRTPCSVLPLSLHSCSFSAYSALPIPPALFTSLTYWSFRSLFSYLLLHETFLSPY